VYGIFLDVTGRKQAEEGHELLAGEMSHRVKNLLAIAAGLTQIASRSAATKEEMVKDMTSRLASLGRAHDLVRPLPGHQGTAALLGDLLSILLSPYEDMGAFSGRIRVAVPRMGVGEAAATTLALVIHELATNSVKYGSLSSDEGTLDVSGSLEGDDIKIIWMERGGPSVEPSTASGYGSRLVDRSVKGQLGGAIDYAWDPDGLIVTLMLKATKLAS
jgi:two-component sensor histidine kinase